MPNSDNKSGMGPLSPTKQPDAQDPFAAKSNSTAQYIPSPPPVQKSNIDTLEQISQNGLESETDVETFMESVGGESTLSEIGAELDLEQARIEEQQFQAREEMIQSHHMRSLLFLALAKQEAHAGALTREQIQKQLDKHSHTSTTTTEKKTESHPPGLESAIQNYTEALVVLQKKQDLNVAEGQKIEKEVGQCKTAREDMDTKYGTFENNLDELDAATDAKPNLSNEDIQGQIDELTTEMESQVDKIGKIVEVDHEAKDLINKHNGLNLKLASLKDMLAVQQKSKFYADAEGNPTDLKKSTLVLDQDKEGKPAQKVVKNDGKFYLLKAGQDFNAIKDSPEAMQKAEQNYEQAKTVKKVVAHNKTTETAVNDDRLKVANEKLSDNKQEHQNIANQITLVQAARANAMNAMQNPNMNQLSSTASTPSIGGSSIAKSKTYSAALSQVRPTNFTQDDLIDQVQRSRTGNVKAATDALNKKFMEKEYNANHDIGGMSRRGYITQFQMQNLLKTIESFGIDIQKEKLLEPLKVKDPNTEPTDKPQIEPTKPELDQDKPKHAEVAKQVENKPEEKKSPTPFSMTPKPYD